MVRAASTRAGCSLDQKPPTRTHHQGVVVKHVGQQYEPHGLIDIDLRKPRQLVGQYRVHKSGRP